MKNLLFLLSLSLFVWSCTDDDPLLPTNTPVPIQPGDGLFILNEGGFNAGNASLDFLRLADDRLFSGLYESENDQPIGDVLQSAVIWKDQIYLVVNNSQKIIGLDVEDLAQETEIAPFTSPRFLHPLPSGIAYVTDLFSNYIHRVDLNTGLMPGDPIQVNGWTEEMVRIEGEVFVASRFSNTIYIIDTLTHQLSDSIAVDFDPASLAVDKNSKLWALCTGDEFSLSPGALLRIDPTSREIEVRHELPDYNTGITPKVRLNPDRDILYYLKEDIFKMGIDDAALPASPLIPSDGRTLYALEIHPLTGSIFTSDAVDFVQRGMVYRYTADGTQVQSFTAGVNPNGFVFY